MDRQHAIAGVERGRALLKQHPAFSPLLLRARVNCLPGNRCPPGSWAAVIPDGRIYANAQREASPEAWARAIAHALLHLGLGHVQERDRPALWHAACDCVVEEFLTRLGLGDGLDVYSQFAGLSEERLYAEFCASGLPDALQTVDTDHPGAEMLPDGPTSDNVDWQYVLGRGLQAAVDRAVECSTGKRPGLRSETPTPGRLARTWFIREYPMLGALASAFTIIEDAAICARLGIAVAAVVPALREIYVNPTAGLDQDEYRFVIGHELLHVGLLHHRRRYGRDHYQWNCACDFVINAWLLQLGVGAMPPIGVLHDPALAGLSADAIYERIRQDVRWLRRGPATLAGYGVGDILDGDVTAVGLDQFYRRCLANGLQRHILVGRGTVPAGMIEEVLGIPATVPVPWDVQLGRWFEEHVVPPEKIRTYARPSRRQSATPDIPRARIAPLHPDTQTFGVVLDTSGSMGRDLLAAALGAIAGYAASRDVAAVRLIFCDASPYDQGYIAPERLLHWVDIRGRGGTILQPAIDLLEDAPDFPVYSPVLIITDGYCDSLSSTREHAFVVPPDHVLPFVPGGPVFELE